MNLIKRFMASPFFDGMRAGMAMIVIMVLFGWVLSWLVSILPWPSR